MKKEQKRKPNRRSKAKYAALQPKFNLRLRKDYIEPEYINGIYDQDGNQVIRPLNDVEKDFLNRYYEETVGANFLHDSELRDLYDQMKPLKRKKRLNPEEEKLLKRLEKAYRKRADNVLLYPDIADQRELYKENNSRNACLMNRIKATGNLFEINNDTYNGIHDNVYYCADSGENLLINQIESKPKVIVKKAKKDGPNE